jgi:hypothetical protein
MFFLVWFIVLGLISYYLLQSSTSRITRTPVWLLWLVMMAPALIWSGWLLVKGASKTVPPELVIIPFLVCPFLYWFLVQLGRKEIIASTKTQVTGSATEPTKPKVSLRPINSEEEASLRDCFPWSIYFLRDLEFRPQAVICRGQLRTNPEAAYQTIRENVEQHFGDRFLVIFQNSLSGQPFFAIVPNPSRQSGETPVKTESVTRPFFALALVYLPQRLSGRKLPELPKKLYSPTRICCSRACLTRWL